MIPPHRSRRSTVVGPDSRGQSSSDQCKTQISMYAIGDALCCWRDLEPIEFYANALQVIVFPAAGVTINSSLNFVMLSSWSQVRSATLRLFDWEVLPWVANIVI